MQNTQGACATSEGLQKEHQSLGRKKGVRLRVISDQMIHFHSQQSPPDMSKEHAETEEEQPDKTKKIVSTSRRAKHLVESYIN
jgi:hypothetical protein